MKKVVVVVGEEKIVFEGEQLQMINKSGMVDVGGFSGSELLIVEEKKDPIAIFRTWDWWKKIE